MDFLRGEDRIRYRKILEQLDNDFLKGKDSYPKILPGTYIIITDCW